MTPEREKAMEEIIAARDVYLQVLRKHEMSHGPAELDREELKGYREREPLVQELLEAADCLGGALYPILVDHDYNMQQNFQAAAKVRDFKVAL